MSPTGKIDVNARDGGFTLIEIIAVLTLIVLISGAVISSIPSRNDATNLTAAAIQLVTHLRDARSRAINRQQQNVVIFDIDRHIINFGRSRKILRIDRDIIFTLYTADSEFRTARVTGIRFFPNGSSTGGTVQLKRKTQAYEITVNWLNGRVRLRSLKPKPS